MSIARAQPGQALQIFASDWNQIADHVEGNATASATNLGSRYGGVLVKNNTGDDLARMHVAQIDGMVLDPAEAKVASEHVFEAVQVDDPAKTIAVALEPIADGKIGKACVHGLAPVIVDVIGDTPETVGPEAGLTKLSSSSFGVKVIWCEPGTGERFALVDLSGGQGGGLFPVTLSAASGSAGDKTTPAAFTYTVTSLDDVELGTSISPEMQRSNGKKTAATIGTAYYAADRTLKLHWCDEVYATGEC